MNVIESQILIKLNEKYYYDKSFKNLNKKIYHNQKLIKNTYDQDHSNVILINRIKYMNKL